MPVIDTNQNVVFIKCTSAQYAALETKDVNSIYFITDTYDIYVGEDLYTGDSSSDTLDQIQFVSTLPEFASAESDVIYIVSDGNDVTIYVKGDTEMVQASGSGSIDIADLDNILDKAGSLTEGDDRIPTSGTVKTAIEQAVSELDSAIVDVSAERSQDNSGTVLTFTQKSGTEKTVTIADLFLSAASYDSESHTLTLSVTGSANPVQVNLEELIPQSVSTSDVAMSTNITVTTQVGNFNVGDVIDISSTQTLQQFLVAMLCQDSNPTVTQPSASITLTSAGAKEVGTTFTPSYSASLNVGSYSANANGSQPTGVTATSWTVTDTAGHTSNTQTGSFDTFTVEDSTNYRVSVSVEHTAGNIPTTYLGEEYPAGQIQAGTKTANSSYVTGYRQGFYGTLTDKTGEINSTLVRSLSSTTGRKVQSGQTYTITVPAGVLRIVLAYEASVGDVSSITSAEEFGSEIKDSFVQYTVNVEGANNYEGVDYYVYVKDLASEQGTATTYTVTI